MEYPPEIYLVGYNPENFRKSKMAVYVGNKLFPDEKIVA